MAGLRRNVELKARDPNPERSLATARELGASDEGVLRQRDTYFRAHTGRLKLREQQPGGAVLIQLRPPGRGCRAREPVSPHEGRRPGCAAGVARRGARHARRRRQTAASAAPRRRADPPRHRSPASARFVELEGVRAAGLRPQRRAREGRAAARGARDSRRSPQRLVLGSVCSALTRSSPPRPRFMERAYAPYSHYKVGAALRSRRRLGPRGRNVETRLPGRASAPRPRPSGCWSPRGAPVVTAPGDRELRHVCPPCGGCRQRLREFTPLDAHHLSAEGGQRTRPSRACCRSRLGPELLARHGALDVIRERPGVAPRSGWSRLGSCTVADARRGHHHDPLLRPAGLPQPSVAGHAGVAVARHALRPAGRDLPGPRARLRGAATPPACASPSAR